MRRRLVIAGAVGLVAVAATVVVLLTRPDGIRHAAPCRGPAGPAPVAGHPRLFVRAGDLDRLRRRATDANPVYTAGLAQLAERAKDDMDAGRVPGGDRGRDAYEEYPTESYAELFAFQSLIGPDQAARDDYGRRACSLLMDIIGRSEARQPTFATFDRSRWWGEAFPLTVDWAYPYFDAAEQASIRAVFLRWSDDLVHAHTTDYNHPEPIGVTNDPALLADRTAVRWSLNNYYTAHMRNLGLMALATDDAELHKYLDNATGCLAVRHRPRAAHRRRRRARPRRVRIRAPGHRLRRPVPGRPAHRRPGRSDGREPVLDHLPPGAAAFAVTGDHTGAAGAARPGVPAGLVRLRPALRGPRHDRVPRPARPRRRRPR